MLIPALLTRISPIGPKSASISACSCSMSAAIVISAWKAAVRTTGAPRDLRRGGLAIGERPAGDRDIRSGLGQRLGHHSPQYPYFHR
jgi:hypothetical protein